MQDGKPLDAVESFVRSGQSALAFFRDLCYNEENIGIIGGKSNMDQRELYFRVSFPKYDRADEVYFCIMHHPIRSAWITPTSYPVDELSILYNGLWKEPYIHETSREKWVVTQSDGRDAGTTAVHVIPIRAKWDQVVPYYADIYNAIESWDFIFSKAPIHAEQYLDGYVPQSDKEYVREADLIEARKRWKETIRWFEEEIMREKNRQIPKEIQQRVRLRIKLEFLFEKRRLGLCHQIWAREKQLYAQYGYTWYSPDECCSDVTFD